MDSSIQENQIPENLTKISESQQESLILNEEKEEKKTSSPSKRLKITPQKKTEPSKITKKTPSIDPCKNNKVMDKMEQRAIERIKRREEILKKKQEQKLEEEKKKKEASEKEVNSLKFPL